jgi:phage terminase small subunit
MPKSSKPLTDKQQRFVLEYLKDSNATQAAIRAGYSARTADRIGAELLGKTWVAAAIAAKQARLASKLEVSAERVIAEFARIAFSDPRQVATWGPGGVTLKDSAALTDDAAACVSEVKSKPTEYGNELTFKLHDKVVALNALGKHLGLFKEQIEVTLSLEDILDRARKRRSGGSK